jgi:hypothetical protein
LQLIVASAGEDVQLGKELLELAAVKETAGAYEIFFLIVILLNKFDLLWGSIFGFVSGGSPAFVPFRAFLIWFCWNYSR